MAFARRGEDSNESYGAQVMLFQLAETRSQEQFVELIRGSVEADAPPDRFTQVEAKYEYSELRGYPCVRYAGITEDTKAKTGLFSRESLKLQIEALYCRHPVHLGAGFMAGFSHRGNGIDPELRQQADKFIEGVQVPVP